MDNMHPFLKTWILDQIVHLHVAHGTYAKQWIFNIIVQKPQLCIHAISAQKNYKWCSETKNDVL